MSDCTLLDFNQVRTAAASGDIDGCGILRYIRSRHRPDWMADEQWNQFVQWNRGEAVPTDPEIIAALCQVNSKSRGYKWVWSNVASCLVGPNNYYQWCTYIDNTFDVGL